ncbi:MAG: Pyruvate formate lyase [Promethearchaeota archaeon]|nr:MAG: Pyruvate formate lyase [Candidatus Lokiarchaeota archaeon]
MSKTSESSERRKGFQFDIAKPHDMLPKSHWLREYYFKGAEREWNNEFTPFTTGTEWDLIWNELNYYIVPEVHMYIGNKGKGVFETSFRAIARPIELPDSFWKLSIPERRIIFFEHAILNYIPQEIISENDLIAGGRFNTQLSNCLNKKETKQFWKKTLKARQAHFKFHKSGFGNTGATGGHIIPDYETILNKGFKFLYKQAKERYERLSDKDKNGAKGGELRAMIRATEIPKKLAQKYAEECRQLKKNATPDRAEELEQMAKNLEKVPWEPAETFWQGLQAIWLTHMLIMTEESYPGAGTSFGRTDQHLWRLYKKDVMEEKNITKNFAKEILGSFWFHCNTAYDAMVRVGKQGITSGFGQLMTLSGCGPNGEDLTNELTYTILEVIDEWSPILEPKPNIRLHRNSPDKLLDILVDMVSRSQGAPFLINFDERSIAGMVREGISKEDAWDYACVGCLENTMQGNDRSGTVNCNPNLAKSIELTLWNGKNMPGNVVNGWTKDGERFGPKTGKPEKFETWEEFFNAWKQQIAFIIKYLVEVNNMTEEIRGTYLPTPYLSTFVRGCIEKGLDVRNGGPELRFITVEGVGYATTVDSLLAIKKLVYEDKKYTISEIKNALLEDFQGKDNTILQTVLKNKAPKYGNDTDMADELAREVMETWAEETWKYKSPTDFQYRPGMLSWNYWAGADAMLTPATPNGRNAGTYLSNAICPSDGVDKKGPTAVTNSVGKALGGKTEDGEYINYLPNGASHTITFNPSIIRDPEHKEKFKSYLRGYIENGGTCLQINMLDVDMLRDAQKHPENYENLLVRVTGYNAYFTAIGKELQNEIIARESHRM